MPPQRKILVVSGIFHPESGGPATYLHAILPQLQELDWDVRVLTFGGGPRTSLFLRMHHYDYPSLERRVAEQNP